MRRSALQQGRQPEEMKANFVLTQHAGIFLGRSHLLRSPPVQNLDDLKKPRKILEPLRGVVKPCRRNYNVFEHFSPEGLQKLWEQFQSAAAEMYQVVGRNEDRCLRRLRRLYDASEPLRMKHKHLWERRYMCQHDKKKHRPKHWVWSAPKFLRSGSPVSSTLEDLKRLLERWKRSLKLA